MFLNCGVFTKSCVMLAFGQFHLHKAALVATGHLHPVQRALYRKTLFGFEGTLPTNDDLLGCKLEAVHDVAILDLSIHILSILPPNPTPLAK